jgi:ABC-type antimicrobial peptide transport system permease subunit
MVAMVSVGQGVERSVSDRIRSMGADLVVVTAGQVKVVAGRPRQTGNVTSLRLDDVRGMIGNLPDVRSVAPAQQQKLTIKWSEVSTQTSVIGTTPEYAEVRDAPVSAGRYFGEEELRGALRVAVIGPRAAENAFGTSSPIGETLRIQRVPFTVIGVLAARGLDSAGQDQDDVVLVPVTSALRRLFNLDYINSIYVQAHPGRTSQAANEVRVHLRDRHRLRAGKDDDFTIEAQSQVLAAEQEAAQSFTMLIGTVAAVALLIGGVGILAVMLIAVRERVREIGLRRAVGATARDVLGVFVLEALIIGSSGGLAGTALGVVAALVAAKLGSWPVVLSPGNVLLAVAVSAAGSVVFGAYPARRAAGLDPSAALRAG